MKFASVSAIDVKTIFSKVKIFGMDMENAVGMVVSGLNRIDTTLSLQVNHYNLYIVVVYKPSPSLIVSDICVHSWDGCACVPYFKYRIDRWQVLVA